MDIQKQAVKEYLLEGYSYRALAEKYNVSRSTINKWVLVYQGIHNIPRSHKQTSYDLQQKTLWKRSKQPTAQKQNELEKKISLLEKQLEWEKLRSHALDTMINVAERQWGIDIQKKLGTKQSEKGRRHTATPTCSRSAGCLGTPGRRFINTSSNNAHESPANNASSNRCTAFVNTSLAAVAVNLW